MRIILTVTAKVVAISSQVMSKQPKLGSGERFKAIEKKAAASGARDPAAVAAAAGIKKYGEAKMTKLAQAGKAKKGKQHGNL